MFLFLFEIFYWILLVLFSFFSKNFLSPPATTMHAFFGCFFQKWRECEDGMTSLFRIILSNLLSTFHVFRNRNSVSIEQLLRFMLRNLIQDCIHHTQTNFLYNNHGFLLQPYTLKVFTICLQSKSGLQPFCYLVQYSITCTAYNNTTIVLCTLAKYDVHFTWSLPYLVHLTRARYISW